MGIADNFVCFVFRFQGQLYIPCYNHEGKSPLIYFSKKGRTHVCKKNRPGLPGMAWHGMPTGTVFPPFWLFLVEGSFSSLLSIPSPLLTLPFSVGEKQKGTFWTGRGKGRNCIRISQERKEGGGEKWFSKDVFKPTRGFFLLG